MNEAVTETHPAWLIFRYEMAGTLDQNICPVSLLMHDASESAGVVEPVGRWPPREALDPAKSCILEKDG